jgi:hypothetical protein
MGNALPVTWQPATSTISKRDIIARGFIPSPQRLDDAKYLILLLQADYELNRN